MEAFFETCAFSAMNANIGCMAGQALEQAVKTQCGEAPSLDTEQLEHIRDFRDMCPCVLHILC